MKLRPKPHNKRLETETKIQIFLTLVKNVFGYITMGEFILTSWVGQ